MYDKNLWVWDVYELHDSSWKSTMEAMSYEKAEAERQRLEAHGRHAKLSPNPEGGPDLQEGVLNSGYVKLVACVGDDLTPLEAARMSTGNATGVDQDKDDRTRDFLWKMDHSSPFEMNVACFELQLPLFVLRQLDRHRVIAIDNPEVDAVFVNYDDFRKFTSRNEFSGRYSEMPDLYYIPSDERLAASGKHDTNKQGSGSGLPEDAVSHAKEILTTHTADARRRYEKLLQHGVASELARLVLPQNQYTKIRIQAAMLNWFKFFTKRLPEDAQWETRQYAQPMARMLRSFWSRSWSVFENYTLYARKLSRDERLASFLLLDELGYSREHYLDVLRVKASFLSEKQRRELLNKLWPEHDEKPLV